MFRHKTSISLRSLHKSNFCSIFHYWILFFSNLRQMMATQVFCMRRQLCNKDRMKCGWLFLVGHSLPTPYCKARLKNWDKIVIREKYLLIHVSVSLLQIKPKPQSDSTVIPIGCSGSHLCPSTVDVIVNIDKIREKKKRTKKKGLKARKSPSKKE